MNVIALPTGAVKVIANDIPLLIASAIIPESLASTERITAIEKFATSLSKNGINETEHSVGYLSENELSHLSKACRLAGLTGLLSVIEKKETNISDWAQFETAIKIHSPKLQYTLKPVGKTLLQITKDKHREYLEIAIENGDVVAHDCMTHLPLKHAKYLTTLEKAYLTISAFEQYVAKFNLKVEVANNQISSNHSQIDNSSEISAPPCIGKLNAINQLAVEIAWKLEQEKAGSIVTAKSVMLELIKMATEKSNPILKGLIPHGVKWFTSSSGESSYDIGACRQTLSRWRKRCQIASVTDSLKSQSNIRT